MKKKPTLPTAALRFHDALKTRVDLTGMALEDAEFDNALSDFEAALPYSQTESDAFDAQFTRLTVKEAAAELGLSVESIQKFIRTGQLPAQKLADVWTVYQADVESLKDRKTKPGPAKRT